MGHEEYITRHFSGMQLKGQDAHIDAKVSHRKKTSCHSINLKFLQNRLDFFGVGII